MEKSTADTKERSPVQSPCKVVTSVTHDSQSPKASSWSLNQLAKGVLHSRSSEPYKLYVYAVTSFGGNVTAIKASSLH